jgi:ribosomal protein L35
MKKSVSKRIKVTGTGKLVRRQMAQDHFKAKHPGSRNRSKRKDLNVKSVDQKTFIKYLRSNN